MSINITSNGSISHNPALDVKSPELKPGIESRPRDEKGRFTYKEAKSQESKKDSNMLVGGAPYIYNIIKHNKILDDACRYNQLADAIYLGRGSESYYIFKFGGKSSEGGTMFGFHYDCGMLKEVLSHNESYNIVRKMEFFDSIQKFTF